ncbi:MAG: hypothetical protein H6624_08090 [Bdellovibrionaceae bacterium]|nr:hypothetical protein [Bdellovibrionales bacterium]MCB9084292.1 hypothetical protein [Pseudobdellovibrionaceae bacterium]
MTPIRYHLSLISFLLIMVGCKAHHDIPADDGMGFDKTTESLDFATTSSEVLDRSCVRCHEHYSDYDSVVRELREIGTSVRAGRMPKDGPALSRRQRELLLSWVDAGGPREVGDLPIDIPERNLQPTWESLSENLFRPHCVVCHNPNGQVKYLDFSSYDSTMSQSKLLFNHPEAEKTYLIQVILDPFEPMPPKNSRVKRLDQEQLSTLLEWIRLGFPE